MRDRGSTGRIVLGAIPLALIGLILGIALIAGTGSAAAGCTAPFTGAPTTVTGIPQRFLPIYEGAAQQFSLGPDGWAYLAAINKVESNFDEKTLPGVAGGANYAGAAGPMQIGIGGRAGDTWDHYKVPGVPAGVTPPSVYDEADAVYAAANILKTNGAPGDWQGAIFAYNHSTSYVAQVTALARGYYARSTAAGGIVPAAGPGTPPVTQGNPFPIPPARNDPAGPITLMPGQPQLVAATDYVGSTGAWGDNLTVNSNTYAELSPGLPASAVTRQSADMLGALPYMTALQVTNPQNGRALTIYKRDVGAGQPLTNTLDGYHYRIDLYHTVDQQLGLSGSGIVQITLLGAGQATSSGSCLFVSGGIAPPGSGIDPIPGFTIGRDDMGVDGSAPVGTPIYAPFASQLVLVHQNWWQGQPLLELKFLTPPPGALSQYWYLAEQINPVTENIGTIFPARAVVARFAPCCTGIETGWGSLSSTQLTLAGVTDPAAAHPPPGASTVWAESFKRYFGIP